MGSELANGSGEYVEDKGPYGAYAEILLWHIYVTCIVLKMLGWESCLDPLEMTVM
jgi:hypothetical protein